jgi:LPS-assembly protein
VIPPGCEAHEVVTWELAEKYFFDPTFGGALQPGQLNVLESTVQFNAIAFITQPRNWAPIASHLRWRGTKVDTDWQLDYDPVTGHLSSSNAMINYRFSPDYALGGGDAVLEIPSISTLIPAAASSSVPAPSKFNQFRVSATYGRINKPGLSAAVTVGYDAIENFLQYTSTQASYNWDCCGMTVEYRRFALGALRNENEFRFALSLTNVGTFGDIHKQERLY